jgi:hypothetical protein
MDPVVHMIFKAVASRLAEINDKINNISDSIINDLACRIFFDGLLHPIPSSTVLKFTTGSSATTVDILTEAYWINTSVQPSATYFFAPVEPKELFPVEAVFALSISSNGIDVLWTNPSWKDRGEFLGHFETAENPAKNVERDYIYIGLKPMGQDIEIQPNDLYIDASLELLDLLRWSRWRCSGSGGALGDIFIPGQVKLEETWRGKSEPKLSLWGHNYYPYEHKDEYKGHFFGIDRGEAGNTPKQLTDKLPNLSGGLLDNLGPLYWIQVESDNKIPIENLKSFELAAMNCMVGINAHYLKQSYFYQGPGPMEIKSLNSADEIFEITALDDNHGRSYENVYTSTGDGKDKCRYVPRIDGNEFTVIVIPSDINPLPDRFSLEYRISLGEAANDISPGLINALYNPHPGIESVINLTPTRGGTSARSFNDMLKAFPDVLRSSNRAVVPSDFESLSVSFDRRIKTARARPGSIERDGVMRSCVEMEVDLGEYSFKHAGEESFFLSRLARFLETRSPVGTVVTARLSR